MKQESIVTNKKETIEEMTAELDNLRKKHTKLEQKQCNIYNQIDKATEPLRKELENINEQYSKKIQEEKERLHKEYNSDEIGKEKEQLMKKIFQLREKIQIEKNTARLPYPENTVVYKWNRSTLYNKHDYHKTRDCGLIQIYRKGDPIPKNSSYAPIGEIIIRFINKDGKPSKAFQTYYKNWHPENVDPNKINP